MAQLTHTPQDDLYTLDESTLSTLRPIHALIFLFKWVGGAGSGESVGVEIDPLEGGVWFANQVSWGGRGAKRRDTRQGERECGRYSSTRGSPRSGGRGTSTDRSAWCRPSCCRQVARLVVWLARLRARYDLGPHSSPGRSLLSLALRHTQVINNSCATVAALNAVMNIQSQASPHAGESIDIGPELANLRDFGAGMGSME